MDEKEHFLTDLNWTSSNKHNELLKIDSNDYVMGRQEQNYRKKKICILHISNCESKSNIKNDKFHNLSWPQQIQQKPTNKKLEFPRSGWTGSYILA